MPLQLYSEVDPKRLEMANISSYVYLLTCEYVNEGVINLIDFLFILKSNSLIVIWCVMNPKAAVNIAFHIAQNEVM